MYFLFGAIYLALTIVLIYVAYRLGFEEGYLRGIKFMRKKIDMIWREEL